MKAAMTIWMLAAVVYGTPIERRQLLGSSTSNELEGGSCGDVIFIFARGSTEIGNMGSTVGPPTCSGLKEAYGNAICQGVGGGYAADLGSNALPDGTSAAGLREAADMFALAASQCPDASIVAGGYSQGAALMAGAVGALDATAQAQVKGVVLYGYTKNLQNNGRIPNYPADQTKVFCNASDGVCSGTLAVTAGHLTYTADVDEAVEFLEGTIASGQSSSGTTTGGFTGTTTAAPAATTSRSSSGLGGFGSGSFGSLFGKWAN
ncbi:putative cutinase/acetylxylan esterase, alpha/Beta hydrolase, cutinase, serine active [Septoria linicola]|nr:putative cutinase/acetylxylan esterase, alpha/Beta hydrolase, cutinase, serine active [Septoria linicola]